MYGKPLNQDYNDLKEVSGELLTISASARRRYWELVDYFGYDRIELALATAAKDCSGGLCNIIGPSRGGGGSGGDGSLIGPPPPPPGPVPTPSDGPSIAKRLAYFLCDDRVRDALKATGNAKAIHVASAIGIACAAGKRSWADVDWEALCMSLASVPIALLEDYPASYMAMYFAQSLCKGVGKKLKPAAAAAKDVVVTQLIAAESSGTTTSLTQTIMDDGIGSPFVQKAIGGMLPRVSADLSDEDNFELWVLAATLESSNEQQVRDYLKAGGAKDNDIDRMAKISGEDSLSEVVSGYVEESLGGPGV